MALYQVPMIACSLSLSLRLFSLDFIVERVDIKFKKKEREPERAFPNVNWKYMFFYFYLLQFEMNCT